MTPLEKLIGKIEKFKVKNDGIADYKFMCGVNETVTEAISTIRTFLKDYALIEKYKWFKRKYVPVEKAYLECLEAESKDMKRIQKDYALIPKGDLRCICCKTEFKDNCKMRELNVKGVMFKAKTARCPKCGHSSISEKDIEEAMDNYEKALREGRR